MGDSSNEHVVYVGPFYYPDGGAAARRILGNVQTLQVLGYVVTVASGQMDEVNHQADTVNDVEVVSLNERTAEYMPRLLKHMAYLTMGKKTIAWLDSLETKPVAVILYSGYSPYLIHLLLWSRRNNVRLIFDAVEWYDPGSILGWASPYQLNIEFAMRCLLPRLHGVISISDYLNAYYLKKNSLSVNVPPTLDVLNTECRVDEVNCQRTLELVYSGSPGRKDLLNNILEAVFILNAEGTRVHITVAGVSESEGLLYSSVRARLNTVFSECITFIGLVSHQSSLALLRAADFSVLLRNDARYSRAGFPTKFVESMASGTPVIANITSDLHRHLHEAKTGFICNGPSPEDLVDSVKRALAQSNGERLDMRSRCRKLAEECFDFRKYTTHLAKLIKP